MTSFSGREFLATSVPPTDRWRGFHVTGLLIGLVDRLEDAAVRSYARDADVVGVGIWAAYIDGLLEYVGCLASPEQDGVGVSAVLLIHHGLDPFPSVFHSFVSR